MIDPLLQATTTVYDMANRPIAIIDAEFNITSTVYDAAGKPIAVIDANGYPTTVVYDPANRKIALIDANGYATSFVYDDANRKVEEINADGGIITTSYDPASNIILVLDPRNEGSTNTYDAANRLLTEAYTDGNRFTYTYDHVANRLTSDSSAGLFTNTYDPRNQLIGLAEPGGKVVSYTYDPANRRTEMSAYGKGTFSYVYDAANREIEVTTPQMMITTFVYDPLARMIQRHSSNGAVTTQTYDPAGNLSGITNNGPSGLVSQLIYTYNSANQRITQLENDGTLTTWTYDNKYQLINEDRAGGPAGTSFNLTHTYDPAGNHVQQNDGTTLITYTYDPANRLTLANASGTITTYTNDLAGNRTGEISPSDPSYYTWDAPGRMATAEVTAGMVTFTYNAEGQRTAKQSTDGSVLGFLYDHKKLLAETDDVGGDVATLYATTTDQEFGDLIGEDGEYIHQYDAQSNTNALLDVSGTVEATYKYYAFGNVASFAIEGDAWASLTIDQWANMTIDEWAALPLELTTNMLAGGKKQYYMDPETELLLLGVRYYKPIDTRFLSEDPIRQAAGDLNLGKYVRNNPINKLDPSGHDDHSTPGVVQIWHAMKIMFEHPIATMQGQAFFQQAALKAGADYTGKQTLEGLKAVLGDPASQQSFENGKNFAVMNSTARVITGVVEAKDTGNDLTEWLITGRVHQPGAYDPDALFGERHYLSHHLDVLEGKYLQAFPPADPKAFEAGMFFGNVQTQTVLIGTSFIGPFGDIGEMGIFSAGFRSFDEAEQVAILSRGTEFTQIPSKLLEGAGDKIPGSVASSDLSDLANAGKREVPGAGDPNFIGSVDKQVPNATQGKVAAQQAVSDANQNIQDSGLGDPKGKVGNTGAESQAKGASDSAKRATQDAQDAVDKQAKGQAPANGPQANAPEEKAPVPGEPGFVGPLTKEQTAANAAGEAAANATKDAVAAATKGAPVSGDPNLIGPVDEQGANDARDTGETVTEPGTGEYGDVGGHHVHAKAAFKGDPNYDPDKGFSVSQDYMKNRGWDHQAMTSKQRELFNELAKSGRLNTLSEHSRIAEESLVAGGATRGEAQQLVQQSTANLAKQSVTTPTHIPWN